MSSVAMPDLLNQIARAGAEGLPWSEAKRDQAEFQLCLDWGVPLKVSGGRVRLPFDPDSLVPAWIEAETPGIAWNRLKVAGFFIAGSTNDEALAHARGGAPGGFMAIAEAQTSGRGRKGRQWISAPGEGLYFSLVVRSEQPLHCWPILSHVASSAVARTMQDLYQMEIIPRRLQVDLKWPNDVLLSSKKAAGILLETTAAGPAAPAAIIGIGINVGAGSRPPHLQDKTTALNSEAGTKVARRRLLVLLLTNLQHGLALFEGGDHSAILDQWKKYSSMWNGVPVWVCDDDVGYAAVTCGLSEMGALRVRTLDGISKTLLAGDVSIRSI